jgi:hypothetical protein
MARELLGQTLLSGSREVSGTCQEQPQRFSSFDQLAISARPSSLTTTLHSIFCRICHGIPVEMATAPPPTGTGLPKLDAAKAQLAAKIDPNAPTGINLYSRFAFAGAVCCAVTHGALTPVDVYVRQFFRSSVSGQWLAATLCTCATAVNDDAMVPS